MNVKPGTMEPTESKPRIITITGGSGSGKSHSARLLDRALAPHAASLTLDHFYLALTRPLMA